MHGPVPALWRAARSDYVSFSHHLRLSDDFPTTVPWPLADGWWVTDFATVHDGSRARATLVAVRGWTEADGPVETVVICEEPGVGLGARAADAVHTDPGAHLGDERLRVRVDGRFRSFWPVTGPAHEGERSVVAGEVDGRWMWLVLRPASALLLLAGGFHLVDVSGRGPSLLELPFGGPPPNW